VQYKLSIMKTNKEYPATHSMSTAWYIADEDGNVGILNCNENGPVPWETEQTCVNDLIFGHEEDYKTKKFIKINLTESQIYELLENPRPPISCSDDKFYNNVVAQIEKEHQDAFLQFVNHNKMDCLTISEPLGLYSVDLFDNPHTKELLKSGFVTQFFDIKEFDDDIMIHYSDVDGKSNDVVWDYDGVFKSSPYFIYTQPYSPDYLAERIIVPKESVKLSQVPEALRRRIHRIPMKFNECPKLQIAEFVPCSFTTYSPTEIIDGCYYYEMPLSNGDKAYILLDIDGIDFFLYCSEKEKYHCEDCANCCAHCFAHTFTATPTVMMVVNPFRDFDYKYNVVSDFIIQNSIMLPFLPRIPYPTKKSMAFVMDVKEKISENDLENLYLKNQKYLDDMFRRFNPNVVIADYHTMKLLNKVYVFEKGVIDLGWKKIPFYLESDIENHRSEIESLAAQPYQGKKFPLVISVEEMQKIKTLKNDKTSLD